MAQKTACTCELCDETFATDAELREHRRISHRMETAFSWMSLMRSRILANSMVALLLVVGVACTQNRAGYRDVEEEVQRSLDAAGLRDVTADQDMDKGVVTLSGEVASEDDKARAEQIAKQSAQEQIVANQIAVRPPGFETEAKSAQSSTDAAIEENFRAELIKKQLNTGVDYSATEGVLTLTGEVASEAKRAEIEKLAAAVPNVKQVVNELEVKGQPAASRRY